MKSVAKLWRPFAPLFIAAVAISAHAQPIITTQPSNQSVPSGSNATFSVTATGAAPLAYQWRLAGTNLPSATNASLLLTNLQIGNAGLVTVIVTNVSGSVTSQPALLAIDEHLTFRVLELGTNGARTVQHAPVTGDNRGGIAVSPQIVLVNGDGPTGLGEAGRFSAADLSAGTPLGISYEGLATDFRTERIYCLGNGTNLVGSGGGTVNAVFELDPESGQRTGARITFSTNITLGFNSGVFSGYGRLVLWDASTFRVYDVSLPSGRVTLVTTLTTGITRTSSETWAFWGIAEYFAGNLYLVYVQNSQTIARRRVSAITDLSVAQSFGNLGNMANISFSPSRSRWYFHHIFNSQFVAGDETLGYAKALYTTDPGFPAIYGDPLSRTVFPGDTVTLNVTAFSSQPLNYQWRMNGANITDATNATLVLTNIQPTASGLYSVVAGNVLGSVASANASVFVISVPQILVQPQPRSVAPGTNTTFTAVVQAAPPVSLQWRLNGTNIPNATNSSYTIPVVSSADVGNYSLVASNRYGTSNSVNAALTLLVDSGYTFRIVSLGTDATLIEHRTLTGDDRGGIAVSSNSVFITGDSATARFDASDLSGGSTIGFFDSLVSDLRSQRVFVLMSNLTVIGNSGGTITALRELDPNTGALTTNVVPLSSRITVPFVGTGAVGLFAGYGQIVIHTGSRCYSIAVPSGIVGDLGPMSSFTHRASEAWAYWGIAENFGGATYLVYAQNQTSIVRTRVPDGVTTTVANFINLGDMASFSASVPRGRWYFHYQGAAEFAGLGETLGFCSATFAVSVSPVVDHFNWEPFGQQQGSGVPFPITITARDSEDNIVTNFNGSVFLQGIAAGSGQPVAVTPSVLANFAGGVWTGNITIPQSSPGLSLRAYDLAGHSGVSPILAVSAAENLAVQIFPSATVATVNSGFSYLITVTNSGPSASTGVVLTNVLPPNANFGSATASQGSCVTEAGVVVCDLGAINGGANATVMLELSPNSLGALTNSVRVVRAQTDTHPEDDAVTVITPVALPRITIADAFVTETNPPVIVTNRFAVSLNVTSSVTITVQYATVAATATNVGDYISRSGTLTFAPGVTATNIAVPISADSRFEGNEFFLVNLTNPVNATLVRTQAIGTILEDDPPPLLTLIPSSVSMNEGNAGTTTVLMNARLSAAAALPTTVSLSTSNGSAIAGSDYFTTNALITFTNGASNVLLSFRIIADTVGESNEFFYVNLSNPQNLALAQTQAVINILNDDPTNVLHHFTFGSIGPTQYLNAPFPVTITARDFYDAPATSFNGMASLRAVSSSSGGLLDTVRILSFTLYADTTPTGEYLNTLAAIRTNFPNFIETSTTTTDPAALQAQLADKQVFLIPEQETTPAGQMATLGTAWAGVLNDFVNRGGIIVVCSFASDEHLILNNSGLLAVTKITSSGSETVTKSIDHLLNAGVAVPFTAPYVGLYSTANGIVALESANSRNAVVIARDVGAGHVALVASDFFTLGTGMDRILANAVQWGLTAGNKIVTITPTNTANFVQGVWTGSIQALSPGAGVVLTASGAGQSSGASTPFDVLLVDDVAVGIAPPANPAPVNEGLLFTLTVTNAGPGNSTGVFLTNRIPANVTYLSSSTDHGTVSLSGQNLIANIGTLANGEVATIRMGLRAGAAGSITNIATVHRNEAEAYRANNNVTNVISTIPLTLAVGDVTLREGQSGTTNAVFAVTLSAVSTQSVSVAYGTGNGSATVADNDYQAITGTLTFVPGVVTQMVVVPVIGDVFNELNETFTLNLSNAVNAAIADNQALATIVNDDPLPTIALNDITVTEGLSGLSAATFMLSLSAPSARSVSVSAVTADGSAFSGIDYVGTNVFVSFAPRQTNANVSVLIRGDVLDENEEVFFLNLSGPFNATLAAVQGRAAILNNDGSGGASNRFEWALAPGALAFGKPFDVTLSARDAQGAVQPFNGTAALRGFSGTNPIVIAPTATSSFVNGLWSGTITVLSVVTNFSLLADDGAGRIGQSDPLQLSWADVALGQNTVPSADVGTTFNYTLVVSNRGPHTATSITLSNAIPDLDFVSASSSGCRYENGTVICTLTSLTNGENATITMVVRPRRGGAVTNTASVVAFEGDFVPANNSVSGAVTISGDDDRDGMANDWEVLNGFSPSDPLDANQDADADGHSNLQEYIAGTNPQNASSVLRLGGALNNGQLQLSFRSVAGRVYRIEWTADPRFGAWAALGDEITGDGDLLVTTDPGGANQSARFYRVRVVR